MRNRKQPPKTLRTDARALVESCAGWNSRLAARRITQFLDREMAGEGLTVAQVGLMAQIAAAADDRLGALAERSGLEQSTLSRNLRTLEGEGLIEIAVVENDLRRRAVWLTEAGARRLEAIIPIWRKAHAKLAKLMSPDLARFLAAGTETLTFKTSDPGVIPRMAHQPSLFDGDRESQPTDRLFFAIYPDPGAAARISDLAKRLRAEHELRGTPLALDRFHVTLHHLGDHEGLPPSLVAAAQEAAATISESAFDVAFDYVASFRLGGRKRPFVLRGGKDLARLMAFQQTIGMAMKKAGLGRWVQPQFTPHVTLLYDDHLVSEQPVEPVSWTVRELVLVHSLLGRTQHIPLGRWPLRG